MTRLRPMLALAVVVVLGAFAGRALSDKPFDHWQHRKVFPTCTTCHPGAADSLRPIWPAAKACEDCHDGTVEKTISWKPPVREKRSNLRLAHKEHIQKFTEKNGADTTLACMACHGEPRAPWMAVARTIPTNCVDCHGYKVEHLAAPDSACAACHLPLVEAKGVPKEKVAKFPKPPSHDTAGFYPGKKHGELAKSARAPGARTYTVAPSCETCHARDFCLQCHVDAPEVPAIKALALDPRSLAIEVKLEPPAGHKDQRFLTRHGGESRKAKANCVTCHTQESCLTCHQASPRVAAALHPASEGRSAGAQIERKKPDSHVTRFADQHSRVANSAPNSCNGCHARSQCLECHRPNPGSADSYHPAGFLARHPSSAYTRQSDCAECHNTTQFCASCHKEAGLISAGGLLKGKFHDAQPSFLLGHGQAARQSMESCITCHSEKDCLACHSAQGGRGFNPHGPNFDAERLKKRNPQTCSACHGRAIPGD